MRDSRLLYAKCMQSRWIGLGSLDKMPQAGRRLAGGQESKSQRLPGVSATFGVHQDEGKAAFVLMRHVLIKPSERFARPGSLAPALRGSAHQSQERHSKTKDRNTETPWAPYKALKHNVCGLLGVSPMGARSFASGGDVSFVLRSQAVPGRFRPRPPFVLEHRAGTVALLVLLCSSVSCGLSKNL